MRKPAIATVLALLVLAYAGPWVLAAFGLFPWPALTLAALPFAVAPTALVLRRSSPRGPLIPLVMLHHLAFGALYCAAWLAGPALRTP